MNTPCPIHLEADVLIQLSGETGQTDVSREARLLVCGSFPEKNLTVTEADLDSLVANFSHPVPVKVEHIDSPLDPLGFVECIRRQGAELFGTLTFPPDMASFLSKRGAAKLSIGFLKEPIWRLLEASLTLSPHVKGATLLSDTEKTELIRLRQQVRQQAVDMQIAYLKRTGRVIPATEVLARQMLSQDAVVTLSDGQESTAAAQFFAFLQAHPPLVHLSEMARTHLNGGAAGVVGADPDEDDVPSFSEDELEVMKRLGVKPEDVRKTMMAERNLPLPPPKRKGC